MCVCDPGYTDIDCSRRMCPKGNDVMDERLDLVTALTYHKQYIQLIAAGSLGDGIAYDDAGAECGRSWDASAATLDACFADLVGRSFALTFTSQLNQSYTTRPIVIAKVSDQTGSTDAEKRDATQTATSTAVKDALRELPNYVIDDCEVDCSFTDYGGVGAVYPQLSCSVQFTGSSVAGPQYLLEVEADKCDSGCTPQLSDPVQLKSAVVASTAASSFVQTDTAIASGTSTIDTGSSGAAGSTTIDVAAGGGIVLGDGTAAPTAPFYILIDNEVIKVSSITVDALTVVRGQAGTTDADHADGATVTVLTHGVFGNGAHPDILSSVAESQTADYNSFECGRRGKCDYSSGECECFEGYMGDRCQTQTALI